MFLVWRCIDVEGAGGSLPVRRHSYRGVGQNYGGSLVVQKQQKTVESQEGYTKSGVPGRYPAKTDNAILTNDRARGVRFLLDFRLPFFGPKRTRYTCFWPLPIVSCRGLKKIPVYT